MNNESGAAGSTGGGDAPITASPAQPAGDPRPPDGAPRPVPPAQTAPAAGSQDPASPIPAWSTTASPIPATPGPTPASPAPTAETLLPTWVKVTVLMLAILFAAGNFAAAWLNATRVTQRLDFKPAENFEMIAKFVTAAAGTPAAQHTLDSRSRLIAASHAFTTYAQFHAAANVQATATLAVAGGLSLLAIGFALFLIGADGAFRLQFRHGKDSKLMLSGAAPGLLCFVAGCVLIATGATQRPRITTAEMTFPSAVNAPRAAPLGELP